MSTVRATGLVVRLARVFGYGRLDPAAGDVQLFDSPRENSHPYGVKIAADGSVSAACNGANCLLRVDTETLEVSEIPLAQAGTTVRRLDIDGAGSSGGSIPGLGGWAATTR